LLSGRPPIRADGEGGLTAVRLCPQLALYLSALLSLLTATLLGLLDDLFDIRWRHKLPIPIVASIPLLLVYYAQGGLTTVVMPKGARELLGPVVDLGEAKRDVIRCTTPH
jgi:UDP-N-acetylmuramyl pentapeptide phosphotransferase/UDP-N-acetylglucosamine-1-phosphate transferase